MGSCEWCGVKLGLPARGRSPRFCSSSCRGKAHRANRPAIPSRMRSERRWVRAVGKRPIRPDGRAASSTAPDTWSSFAEVQRGAGDGSGVMLGGGLAVFDLDHCFDGKRLTEWAAAVVEAIDDPIYVERSVSGEGLHVFVEAPEGPGCVTDRFEFYSRRRFIRLGTPVRLSDVL